MSYATFAEGSAAAKRLKTTGLGYYVNKIRQNLGLET